MSKSPQAGKAPTARRAGKRQTKRSRAPLLWGGVLFAVIGLVAFGMASSGLLGGGKGSGDPAPDLVLASTGGQQFRLSDLNGQPRLLYFSFPG